MIWLTWRQSRTQIVTLAAAVVVLGIALAATTNGIGSPDADPRIFIERIRLDALYSRLYLVGSIACYVAPPVIGAFWGAPLIARELETGTFRLAWNQSVPRSRWLAVKLGGLAAVAALLTALLSLTVTWWAGPIDRAVAAGGGVGGLGLPRIDPAIFGARGIVPIAYAVLAVALGALLGLLVRKTIMALALTLVAVVAVQLAMPLLVRPHLMAPHVAHVAITADKLLGLMMSGDPGQQSIVRIHDLRVDSAGPGDWELSNKTVNAAGRVQSSLPLWVADCAVDPMRAPSADQEQREQACFTRLAAEGYQQEVRTQPGSRFWALQWRESAVLLVLAAAVAGLCFVRLRR